MLIFQQVQTGCQLETDHGSGGGGGVVYVEAEGKFVERGHIGSDSGGADEEWSVRFMLGLF